jgi:hypothetical protein
MSETDQGKLNFVIEPIGDSIQLTSATDRLVGYTSEALEKAKATVTELGTEFSSAVANIPAECEHVDLKFSLKFDAEAGIVVSRIGTQASIEISLRIKPSKSNEYPT